VLTSALRGSPFLRKNRKAAYASREEGPDEATFKETEGVMARDW